MRFWSPRHLPPLNPITFIKRSGSRTRRRGYRLRMVRCTPLPPAAHHSYAIAWGVLLTLSDGNNASKNERLATKSTDGVGIS